MPCSPVATAYRQVGDWGRRRPSSSLIIPIPVVEYALRSAPPLPQRNRLRSGGEATVDALFTDTWPRPTEFRI